MAEPLQRPRAKTIYTNYAYKPQSIPQWPLQLRKPQGQQHCRSITDRLLTGLPSLTKIGSVIAKIKFTRQTENAKNERVPIVAFRMRVARLKALDVPSKMR